MPPRWMSVAQGARRGLGGAGRATAIERQRVRVASAEHARLERTRASVLARYLMKRMRAGSGTSRRRCTGRRRGSRSTMFTRDRATIRGAMAGR